MQVILANTPTSQFSFDYYRQAGGDWPDIILPVPAQLYDRTVWLNISGNGNFQWKGKLVAYQGGVEQFSFPLLLSQGISSGDTLSVSHDWTGSTDNPEGLLFNDIDGLKMLPFNFTCACQEIGLIKESVVNPTAGFPRRFFGVRSRTKF